MRFLIFLGFHGRLHKLKEAQILEFMHKNGLGA